MEMVVTTGDIGRAKLQSNYHHQQTNTQFFYRPDTLPVAQPTVSKHWRENITLHGLAYPKLIWGLSTLSLTTNSCWLPWGRVAMPLISPVMPVPPQKMWKYNKQWPFLCVRCTPACHRWWSSAVWTRRVVQPGALLTTYDQAQGCWCHLLRTLGEGHLQDTHRDYNNHLIIKKVLRVRRKQCALAVVTWSRIFSTHRRPPSRGCNMAKI